MIIKLKHCNNIKEGEISLSKNSLNIKYAINGTGKSTLSKAIYSYIHDKHNSTQTLSKLKPFQADGTAENNPEINGITDLNSVKVFDEQYINEFVFRQDELIKGSFDILIRDANFENGMAEISELTKVIRNEISKDAEIEQLLSDFQEITNSFGRQVKKGIHGSSPLVKGFKDGNLVTNVPEEFREYSEFIQHESNYKWAKWQIDGKPFLDLSKNCPYCISDIQDKKNKIQKIASSYDPKVVENINKIVSTFQKLKMYFSDSTNQAIDKFIFNATGFTKDQEQYLIEIKNQIERITSKIKEAQNIHFNTLKDVEKIIELLSNLEIKLDLYSHLNSERTKSKTDLINNSIKMLLEKAGKLQGVINKQNRLIELLIKENNLEINEFLKNAGYKYKVNIIEDGSEYKLKLFHTDSDKLIQEAKSHLSYGERNAFALVLFMYDTLKAKPDVIILDDPISSFDKNKKYAIINMLFRREKFFKNKTVLFLTHDFEPIVDMIYHHTDKFAPPFASFLENNNGILKEKEIKKADIKTFIEINTENIRSNIPSLNKLVYLRRLYELQNNKGIEFQLISNLLHKRKTPNLSENGICRDMTKSEKRKATKILRKEIPNFSYTKTLITINDRKKLIDHYFSSDNNYEKLHIYRILFGEEILPKASEVMKKFINEAFHIEIDYIYQLNPRKYQLVPQYIINECDNHIQLLNI
ncbi:hypothetical protein [Leptospira brenneri]|uniref:Protein CR006 P-loop domain-containing protein n=1 Tax=Leptospira brenneri TaxID=2023182 RepID=A0A2M9XX11_9LEPT|nr:hypothetical protein [Leptospira brenneri]PJZ43902.1 hypothetical protein CH361_18025 [Leptospira brenneri]TGK93013.1 hypothetical protein EHQ30_12355 [Leptospira brenneri]